VSNLVQKFQEYSSWRNDVKLALERYRECVIAGDLADAASDQRFLQILRA